MLCIPIFQNAIQLGHIRTLFYVQITNRFSRLSEQTIHAFAWPFMTTTRGNLNMILIPQMEF